MAGKYCNNCWIGFWTMEGSELAVDKPQESARVKVDAVEKALFRVVEHSVSLAILREVPC